MVVNDLNNIKVLNGTVKKYLEQEKCINSSQLEVPIKKTYFIIKVANQAEESEILPVFKAVEILKESCHAASVPAHFTTKC